MAIKKIVVVGEENCIHGEKKLDAGVDITPGMLIDYASATEVKPHDDDAPAAKPQSMWADETNVVLSGGTIDTDYDDDGEVVSFVITPPGVQLYAWLADGENVAFGATLESDGAGALQAVTTGLASARALEAVNNSAGGAPARILVEAL